jgi:hypothetical protein
VLDDVIVGPERLRLYEEALAPRPQRLIVLAPPLEIALQRAAARGYQPVGERWAHLDREQREKLGDHGEWIDSGVMSVEQTVEAIWNRLELRANRASRSR